MKVLTSKCCGADLILNSDEDFVWAECTKCKAQENKLTHKELLRRVHKFINEPDEVEKIF